MVQAVVLIFIVIFLHVLKGADSLDKLSSSPELRNYAAIVFGTLGWSVLALVGWGLGLILSTTLDILSDEFDYFSAIQFAILLVALAYVFRLLMTKARSAPAESATDLFLRLLRFGADPYLSGRTPARPQQSNPQNELEKEPENPFEEKPEKPKEGNVNKF